jgi:hypothetical protein
MKNKSWLKIIPFVICLFFIAFPSVQAAGLGDAFSANNINAVAVGYDTSGETDIYQIIGTIVQVLLGLLGIIFISLLVFGGILWMTAGGEEAKVEKAQGIIRNAALGLIVVISAYAISYFVINALEKTTLGK